MQLDRRLTASDSRADTVEKRAAEWGMTPEAFEREALAQQVPLEREDKVDIACICVALAAVVGALVSCALGGGFR